jgi:hypothetical protein
LGLSGVDVGGLLGCLDTASAAVRHPHLGIIEAFAHVGAGNGRGPLVEASTPIHGVGEAEDFTAAAGGRGGGGDSGYGG